MCHLQTHPNSTWGSTDEGKGGPSPVSKKIAQKEFLPGELSGYSNQKINFSEEPSDLLDGGGRPAKVSPNNLVARHKPLAHLRPEVSRSSLGCAKTGNLFLKVPPYPLQSGVRKRTSLIKFLSLGRNTESGFSLMKGIL